MAQKGPDHSLQKEIESQGFEIVAGVDEAGRGPLAGPVVAAACYVPTTIRLGGIDDSKKLNPKIRASLFQKIISTKEIAYAVGVVEPFEVDKLNIHNATLEAMSRAASRLDPKAQFLLVDGKFVPKTSIPSSAIVKGDGKVIAIAIASIIAKVTRDQIMLGYDKLYPEYGFSSHMGYGTKQHRLALEKWGRTPIHRKSFR